MVEKRHEARLLEVVILGQRFRQVMLPHHLK